MPIMPEVLFSADGLTWADLSFQLTILEQWATQNRRFQLTSLQQWAPQSLEFKLTILKQWAPRNLEIKPASSGRRSS